MLIRYNVRRPFFSLRPLTPLDHILSDENILSFKGEGKDEGEIGQFRQNSRGAQVPLGEALGLQPRAKMEL